MLKIHYTESREKREKKKVQRFILEVTLSHFVVQKYVGVSYMKDGRIKYNFSEKIIEEI